MPDDDDDSRHKTAPQTPTAIRRRRLMAEGGDVDADRKRAARYDELARKLRLPVFDKALLQEAARELSNVARELRARGGGT
jgi:hypothetical protein